MNAIVAIDARLVGAHSTGDSTYWAGLLGGLSEIESEFRFLLISDRAKPENYPFDRRFEWVELPSKNSRWWSYVSLPLTAKRLGASILHTQYSLSPLASRGVTTVHDVSFLIGPEWFKPRDRTMLRLGVSGAVRRARKVITVSETSKKEIESLLPSSQGKVCVTFNACPPWIQPMRREVAKNWIAENLDVHGSFALSVSTRWPRKNMELAIQAVDRLPAELPLDLVLSGKAGWGDQNRGRRTKPVGYVSEEALSALYSAADIYLCPSRHEGFGLPLLEAFRCGCPVMCSTGGALPEVAGEAALIQPGWNAEEWSHALAATLRDSGKLDSLRESGCRRERDFSWKATAERTLEIYRGAMQ